MLTTGAMVTESLAEHTILCTQVLDHRRLLPVQPTGDHHQHELQQSRRGSHLTPMFASRSYNVDRANATAWIPRARRSFGTLRGSFLQTEGNAQPNA